MDTVRYFLDSDFTSSEKSAIRAGFAAWLIAKNYNGTDVVSITEVTSGFTENVIVYRDISPNGSSSLQGYTNCPAGYIELDPGLADSLLTDVAAHEMGHILGMHHTGLNDSFFDGRTPIMSTCVPDAFDRLFSQDDTSNLLYRRADVRDGIHANPSFERSTMYWRPYGGPTTFATSTSLPQIGLRSLRYHPSIRPTPSCRR